jgi:hypothetical protein
MGVATSGTGLGALMLPLMVQYCLNHYDFSSTLLLLGALSLHCCITGIVMVDAKRRDVSNTTITTTTTHAAAAAVTDGAKVKIETERRTRSNSGTNNYTDSPSDDTGDCGCLQTIDKFAEVRHAKQVRKSSTGLTITDQMDCEYETSNGNYDSSENARLLVQAGLHRDCSLCGEDINNCECDQNNNNNDGEKQQTLQSNNCGSGLWKWVGCKSKVTWSLLGCSVWFDKRFVMFALSQGLLSMSQKTSHLFLPVLAIEQLGQSKYAATSMLVVMGVADVASRVLTGLVMDWAGLRHHRFSYCLTMLALVSISTFAVPFSSHYAVLTVACVLNGIGFGSMVCQRSIVACELMGIDSLANTVAFSTAVQGCMVLVGPLVGGIIIATIKST